MSLIARLFLKCDNCKCKVNYDKNMLNVPYGQLELPDSWKTNYKAGDTVFGHLCGICVWVSRGGAGGGV